MPGYIAEMLLKLALNTNQSINHKKKDGKRYKVAPENQYLYINHVKYTGFCIYQNYLLHCRKQESK
jgi:hypothetical protein